MLVPLAFPCFVLCLMGVKTEGLLEYEGRDHFIDLLMGLLRGAVFDHGGVLKNAVSVRGVSPP